MKNNTTPPKSTIREKLPKIPKKMLDCGGKTDKCLLEGQNTACMKHLNKWYAEISGTLSPQTGEGECKKCNCFKGVIGAKDEGGAFYGKKCRCVCHVGKSSYKKSYSAISDEMEKEFDRQTKFFEKDGGLASPFPHKDEVHLSHKAVLAFLRKHLSMQRKAVRHQYTEELKGEIAQNMWSAYIRGMNNPLTTYDEIYQYIKNITGVDLKKRHSLLERKGGRE